MPRFVRNNAGLVIHSHEIGAKFLQPTPIGGAEGSKGEKHHCIT